MNDGSGNRVKCVSLADVFDKTVTILLDRWVRLFGAKFLFLIPFRLVEALFVVALLSGANLYSAGTSGDVDRQKLVSAISGGLLLFACLICIISLSMAVTFTIILNHADATFYECVRRGLQKPFLTFGVAFSLFGIVGAGIVFGVIPGIILLSRYWLALPVLIIEERGFADAVKRSRELMRGNYLPAMIVIVPLLLFTFFALSSENWASFFTGAIPLAFFSLIVELIMFQFYSESCSCDNPI